MNLDAAQDGAGAKIRIDYDVRVPLSDGVRLAGNLYMPDAPGSFPGILTYIPYLKDGFGGLGWMDFYQRHFASRGYAVMQLDMRGVGSSEGVNPYPFDPRERHDAHEAVEWMAAQPWCTGAVGMWGVSYGAITSISAATTRPPHLKAIIPVHGTDDNWDTLFEHRGSRLMFYADPHWGPYMAANNLLPPLRDDGTPDWLKRWQERLEGNTPWHLTWHGETPTPDYWERAKADPSLVEVPMLAINGWQDGYTEDMARIYMAAKGPKKLLFGPWKHEFPDQARVEPIDFLPIMDAWWDRWLKGIENGVESEPPVTIYVQEKGEWRNELEWPIARTTERSLFASEGGVLTEAPPEGALRSDRYEYEARGGTTAIAYDCALISIGYPADQARDDHLSLQYDSEPLEEDLEVTGHPRVKTFFGSDAPLSEVNIVAKLLDVLPDGRSHLVSYENVGGSRTETIGDHNGSQIHTATVALRPTSYQFKRGHRIRLCVTGANFPFIWPTPRQFSLDLYTAKPYATELMIPVVGAQSSDVPAPSIRRIAEPTVITGPVIETGEAYSTTHQLVTRVAEFNGSRWLKLQVEPNTIFVRNQDFGMSVDADHPHRANTWEKALLALERPTGSVEIRVNTWVTLNALSMKAEIDLDGRRYWERWWEKSW